MCHRYAVGLSADISTASAFLIAPRFVLTVYQIFLVIGEESLNISPIVFDKMHKKETVHPSPFLMRGTGC